MPLLGSQPQAHEGRTHQASDIAKLWQEFLSLPKLIACIGCAVESGKPSVVYGNN